MRRTYVCCIVIAAALGFAPAANAEMVHITTPTIHVNPPVRVTAPKVTGSVTGQHNGPSGNVDRVFVTRENSAGNVVVQFGNGVQGARIPAAGMANVPTIQPSVHVSPAKVTGRTSVLTGNGNGSTSTSGSGQSNVAGEYRDGRQSTSGSGQSNVAGEYRDGRQSTSGSGQPNVQCGYRDGRTSTSGSGQSNVAGGYRDGRKSTSGSGQSNVAGGYRDGRKSMSGSGQSNVAGGYRDGRKSTSGSGQTKQDSIGNFVRMRRP